MTHKIRKITQQDKELVLEMMKAFYSSPAVYTNGSEEIFTGDIDECLSDSPFLEGYVFECEDSVCGYAMLAKSFSTEFGKRCIWLEDIYIEPACRGKGIANAFLNEIALKYRDCVIRLEAEEENEGAVELYKRHGFEFLPYLEMIKHR